MEKISVIDFEKEVIEASFSLPVLADFWADWCIPCEVLGPILDNLEKKAMGKWKLVKINVDENQELASQYKIKSIPYIKVFYKGEITSEFNGLMYEPQFQKWLDENLPKVEG